jgi:predicted GH43/DUF377 family glycosyl hydrolase
MNRNISKLLSYRKVTTKTPLELKSFILKKKKCIDLSYIVSKIINNEYITFFSSTPSIIKYTDTTYLINTRFINMAYNKSGIKIIIPKQYVSLNAYSLLDAEFNRIEDDIFLVDNFKEQKLYPGMGIEDIRLFNFNNKLYFNASFYDEENNRTATILNTYTNSPDIILSTKIFNTTFTSNKICDKNWSFFNFNNELCLIYKWYPVHICNIDWTNNVINLIKYTHMPEFFKNVRGSTPGHIYKNEIWFIVHKTFTDNDIRNYYHSLVVFNLNMVLMKYSQLFKFEGDKVEFCTGLIIEEDRFIISYSNSDITTKIGIYDINYIINEINYIHI